MVIESLVIFLVFVGVLAFGGGCEDLDLGPFGLAVKTDDSI